jgi:hypothetical protein
MYDIVYDIQTIVKTTLIQNWQGGLQAHHRTEHFGHVLAVERTLSRQHLEEHGQRDAACTGTGIRDANPGDTRYTGIYCGLRLTSLPLSIFD